MKHYVSKYLKSVAVFYFGFPLSYILLSALLFDIPREDCLNLLGSTFYWFISILAMVVGYSLWEVRRWGWYLFLVTNFLIAWQNATLIREVSTSQHPWLAFALSVALLGFVTVRVAREIRVPYFFPKIRWWESNPRYKLSVPVKMLRPNGIAIEGQILDLSTGGCFVKVRQDLDQHETVKLAFTAFGLTLECQGTVVWRTQSAVTHPKGLGIKFNPLVRGQKRTLRQINTRLKKIANLYRRSRYLLNQEEFLQRLQEIETKPTASGRRLTG